MADRGKVIKGLECCAAMSGDACRNCPYGNECRDTDLPYGMPHLAADALAILKEQEPIAPSVCGSKEPDGHGCWWYMCSKCKMPIAPKERFCRRCGQAVKWE
jgi:hypothetical protein